jgi:hypothetical protein
LLDDGSVGGMMNPYLMYCEKTNTKKAKGKATLNGRDCLFIASKKRIMRRGDHESRAEKIAKKRPVPSS